MDDCGTHVNQVKPELFLGGQSFPEGPNFDVAGNLYVCNRWDGFIAKRSTDGCVSRFIETGGKPNGARLHRDGRLFIADIGRCEILATNPNGELSVLVSTYQGESLLGPNDLVFDRNGNLYFTDPGLGNHDLAGRTFRWSASGDLTLLAADQPYPNGIALNETEDLLFVAETMGNRIVRFPLDENGLTGSPTTHVQFDTGHGPDGIAFGSDGNLYVTHRGTGTVVVVGPDGSIARRLDAGGSLPSNLAFWEDALYVTEDETGAVYRLAIGVAGLPLFHQQGATAVIAEGSADR